VVNPPQNTWRNSLYGRVWRLGRAFIVLYLLISLSMMFLERWLVYPAPPPGAGDWNATWLAHEDVWFNAADGTRLHGWFVPHSNSKRAVLYCHGNGEHIAFNAELAASLRDTLDASVFLFDYRGYGRSDGRPNEAGCIADGHAAQLWLAERVGIKPEDVILMGRSLGGAIAVALASSNGAQALVLENTFSSMPDIAANLYPWLPVRWVMKNRYDSLSRIKDYAGPVIQSHGAADSLVPIGAARALFAAAPTSQKQWFEFDGLDHNSEYPSGYHSDLRLFLDRVTQPTVISTETVSPL
jgi:fermentation-respiration switch protein FrsA (DUF1100 family)